MPPSNSEASDSAREDAKMILEQVRYLVDDERDFSKKLTDDRKIKLSLLALVVGFGIFNLRSPDSLQTINSLPGIWRLVALWLVLLALVLLAVALLLIAAERDPLSNFLGRVRESTQKMIKARVQWLFRRRAIDANDISKTIDDPRKVFKAALTVLFGDRNETDALAITAGLIVIRIEEYRAAYLKLAVANRRVRRRLEWGTLGLILAFYCVIVLFGVVVLGTALHPVENVGSTSRSTQEGASDANSIQQQGNQSESR